MQDFLHTSHDEVLNAVKRFERMVSADRVIYFDVNQVENIFEFYLNKDLFEQAEKILSIGLKQHPQAPELLLLKASLLADKGNLDEAEQILINITAIEQSDHEAFLTLGWILLQKNDTEKAVYYYKKAAGIAVEDKEDILLEIAFNLNMKDKFSESIYFLERLIEKEPDNESALFELAFSLDKTGKYKKSISFYENLLKLNPFSENGWYNIGILYNKEDRYLEAIQAYDFALSINPYHSEAYFNKGNSLVHHGYVNEALEAYLEHASLNKYTALTYLYIADCWEQLTNYEMAISFYNLVIKEQPDNPDAWYGIATALMETGNFKGGIQAIDKAISINSSNPDYWFAHARGLFEMDKADDAAKSLENGLGLDPHEITGWFELLKLKISIEENFNIMAYLDEIKNRYKDVAAILYLSAIANYKYLNNTTKAIEELKTAIDLDEDGIQNIEEDYPDFLSIPEVKNILHNKSI